MLEYANFPITLKLKSFFRGTCKTIVRPPKQNEGTFKIAYKGQFFCIYLLKLFAS